MIQRNHNLTPQDGGGGGAWRGGGGVLPRGDVGQGLGPALGQAAGGKQVAYDVTVIKKKTI